VSDGIPNKAPNANKNPEPFLHRFNRLPSESIRYLVWVAVGRRPPVLEVSGLVLGDLSRDSDGAASVGDAGGEVVDG